MPLFRPSTLAASAAVTEIADSAGASADSDMTTRAWRSLNAAIKHFNSKYKWNWLWTEDEPIIMVAPFEVGIVASNGQLSASATAGHGILVDDAVSILGVPRGTRVTATASAGIGFSNAFGLDAGAQSLTATVTRDFYDVPSDWKVGFSVRLLSHNKALKPMNRRLYDRSVGNELTQSTPEWYDTFQVWTKGKIRLLPPPGEVGVLQFRYYRAMATATASASTTTLDIPSDYDPYLISWGKWHFLTDKGDGRAQSATTWLSLAQEGLTTMLADQTDQPDEGIMFVPGHYSYNMSSNDNSTTNLPWGYE